MPIDPNNLDISTPEKEGDLKKQLIQEYLQSQMQPSEIDVISPEEQASRRAGAASNDQIQAGLSQMFNAYSGTDAYKPPPSEMDRTNKEINVELQDALRKRSEERKQQDRQVGLVKYLKGPKEEVKGKSNVYVHRTTGAPVEFKDGKAFDSLGNEIKADPKDYIDSKVFAQLQTTGRQERKLSIPSDKQVESLSGLDAIIKQLDNLEIAKKDVNTGVLDQYWIGLKEAAGWGTKSESDVKLYSGDLLADYIKSKSGAAVTDAEARRLKDIVPNINMQDETFNYRLATLKKWMKEKQRLMKMAMTKYQGKKVDIPQEELDASYILDEMQAVSSNKKPTGQEFNNSDLINSTQPAQTGKPIGTRVRQGGKIFELIGNDDKDPKNWKEVK